MGTDEATLDHHRRYAMSTRHDLLELEREAWRALSTDGETAAGHYEKLLAEDVLMLLPGGLVIDDRQAVIDSMLGAPWDRFEITDERVLELDDRIAVVAYRATAQRSDQEYEALFNSTYVRDDGEWRLALHQQTPV
jgi:hypothetical protein